MSGTASPPEQARRLFLRALYGALRAVRESPSGSARVRHAVDQLTQACEPVWGTDGTLRIRVVRSSLYLGDIRLESDIENFVFHRHVLAVLQGAGVGIVRVTRAPPASEWAAFLTLVVGLSDPKDDPTKTVKLRQAMAARSVRRIEVEPPVAGGADLPGEVERRAAARRTYEESVRISRDLFNGTRMGRSANVKEVKQAVQNIVDAILDNETSLGGLSALKDYDDYSFTHAVNVCIFCVAIGRRLGLSKAQLYDLGLAALVHDIGMSRVPRRILTKGDALTPDEQRLMEAHTWLGALSVFELRDYGEIPFLGMIAAYEHHLRKDGSGYPRTVRPREPSVFSRIISVASAFDAATNERAYCRALPADEVLRELWENESLGFDPVVVKALINLLGIYPVGTCVILDTFELALVHAANSDSAYVNRPIVRLLSDPDGHWLEPPPLVDLAETDGSGRFKRSIIKVTSPDRYGIRTADYLA